MRGTDVTGQGRAPQKGVDSCHAVKASNQGGTVRRCAWNGTTRPTPKHTTTHHVWAGDPPVLQPLFQRSLHPSQ